MDTGWCLKTKRLQNNSKWSIVMQDLYSVLNNEERAVYSLRSLYKGYGYTQYKMSKFEEYDL